MRIIYILFIFLKNMFQAQCFKILIMSGFMQKHSQIIILNQITTSSHHFPVYPYIRYSISHPSTVMCFLLRTSNQFLFLLIFLFFAVYLYIPCEGDHFVYVPFFLTNFTQHGTLQFHPCSYKLYNFAFFLQLNNMPLCRCTVFLYPVIFSQTSALFPYYGYC